MKRIDGRTFVALAVLGIVASASAVPVDNWRMPFYRIAAERGEVVPSPSGMFWDDLGAASCLDRGLWPDTASYAVNHLTFEPSLSLSTGNEKYSTRKNSNLHFDLLTDIRFRGFSVRNVLDVDQEYQSDPDYVWKADRGAAGRVDEAYVQYQGKIGFARLGRMNRLWGPFPDRSILLSNNPFSYDGFEWQLASRFFEFRHLFAAFPTLHSDMDSRFDAADSAITRNNRYFTAHALNFILGDWASVGVSETVLFSRPNGFPDMQYVNPVSVYTVINTNTEGQGNLLLGFQGWVHPFTRQVTLKGQVVFDDVQVDNEDKADLEPMHWACDLGAYWTDPLPIALPHHFSMEYRYLSKWMYTVAWGNSKIGERYTYLGRSLANPWIDGDEWRLSAAIMGRDWWACELGFGLARRDTVSLFTPWLRPDSSSVSLGYRKETPLSRRTNVSTTFSVPIKAHAYFRDYCALHVEFENRWVENGAHDMSPGFDYDPRIAATLSVHFSDFFRKFGNRENTN